MNHEYKQVANQLLDKLKDGQEFSLADTNWSLRATGDIAPIRSPRMDQAISQENDGGGQSRGISMVAENLIRLSEKAWTKRR